MFPTPVGMNRVCISAMRARFYVPHTRGDEPGAWKGPRARYECSPHPWG